MAREGSLGDAQQDTLGDGGGAAFHDGFPVGFLKAEDIHEGAGQQIGISAVFHANLAQHLADNDFDVLVAHANALQAVDGENFLQQVFLDGLHAEDTEQVMGIDGAFSQLIAGLHMIAYADLQAGTVGNLISLGVLGILIGGDDQFAACRRSQPGWRHASACGPRTVPQRGEDPG